MKKNALKFIALIVTVIFAGYILATEITGNTADKKLIECFPEKSLTPETVMRVSGCKIVKINSTNNIASNIKTNHTKRVKRGVRRRIFIDLDNDGIADDRNL